MFEKILFSLIFYSSNLKTKVRITQRQISIWARASRKWPLPIRKTSNIVRPKDRVPCDPRKTLKFYPNHQLSPKHQFQPPKRHSKRRIRRSIRSKLKKLRIQPKIYWLSRNQRPVYQTHATKKSSKQKVIKFTSFVYLKSYKLCLLESICNVRLIKT